MLLYLYSSTLAQQCLIIAEVIPSTWGRNWSVSSKVGRGAVWEKLLSPIEGSPLLQIPLSIQDNNTAYKSRGKWQPGPYLLPLPVLLFLPSADICLDSQHFPVYEGKHPWASSFPRALSIIIRVTLHTCAVAANSLQSHATSLVALHPPTTPNLVLQGQLQVSRLLLSNADWKGNSRLYEKMFMY